MFPLSFVPDMDQFINNLEVQLNSEGGLMHVFKQVSYQENEILIILSHNSAEYLIIIIELMLIIFLHVFCSMLGTEKG